MCALHKRPRVVCIVGQCCVGFVGVESEPGLGLASVACVSMPNMNIELAPRSPIKCFTSHHFTFFRM